MRPAGRLFGKKPGGRQFPPLRSQLSVKPRREQYILGQVLIISLFNLAWTQDSALFFPVQTWDIDNNDEKKM